MSNDLKEIIDKVIESCETCQKFQKPPSKPVVAFTKSYSINERLSLDLHELKRKKYSFQIIS